MSGAAKRQSLRVAAAVIFVLLPFVYILSFGPVIDMLDSTPPGSAMRQIGCSFYRPLLFTIAYSPRWLGDLLWSLATLISIE